MVPLLLASGFSFLTDNNAIKVGLVSTFLILYTLAYSPGAGVVPFLYTSEIFPQVLRGKQTYISSSSTFLCRCDDSKFLRRGWNGVGLSCDLLRGRSFGLGGAPAHPRYWTDGTSRTICVSPCLYILKHSLVPKSQLIARRGFDAIALFLVWLLVPGTERHVSSITMEEMNYVFGVSTRTHVHYQLHEVAPWCFDHYLLRREKGHLRPLYRYARSRAGPMGREQ